MHPSVKSCNIPPIIDTSKKLDHGEFLELFSNYNLTESDQQKIIQLFDSNNDGFIDSTECNKICTALNCHSEHDLITKSYLYIIFTQIQTKHHDASSLNIAQWKHFFDNKDIMLSEPEISRLFDVMDSDKNNCIDFDEFVDAFYETISIEAFMQKCRLRVIFNNIDTNSGGSLSFNEIKHLFESEQIYLSNDTLHKMISNIDTNRDKSISFTEFASAFASIQSSQQLIQQWSSLSGVDVGTDLSFTSGLAQNKDANKDTQFPLLPLIAGGFGGICSRTATAPLERIKILAQCGNTSESMTRTIKTITRQEGFFRGLWKGNFYNVLRVFPFGGIICWSYGSMNKQFKQSDLKVNENIFRFAAGCIAGGTATTVTYPLDVIRTRITASVGDNARMDFKECFKSVHGMRSLYAGLWPTLYAMSIFVGLQQSSYDFMRLYATSRDHLNMKASINLFVGCSVTAAVFAQSVTYPLDVIRRRMQINDDCVMMKTRAVQASAHDANIVAHRTWFALRNVVQLQGFKTLFAGIIPTYAKVIPSVAVSVTIRDVLLGRLEA